MANNTMAYTTTLIIPFGFDCDMGEISKIEAKIEKSGIWTRTMYNCSNVYRHIAQLYDSRNKSRIAAIYKASGQTIQDKFAKTREFCLVVNADNKIKNFKYRYEKLQLYVFESGVGFLCIELSFDEIEAIKCLRDVVKSGISHMRYTSNNMYGEEYPMIKIIKQLLSFNENDIFFSTLHPDKFAQAITFSYANTTSSGNKTTLYSLLHMVSEDEYSDETENFGEEYIIPFRGFHWGISSRTIAVVQDEHSKKSQKDFQGELFSKYLPLIILAYHQKYAMIKFSAMVNGSPAQIKDARNDIIDFKVRSSFVSVSDTQVLQQIYDKIMSVNKIEDMIKENDRKLDNLLTRENNEHRAKLEKVTGVITLLFTIMGITSILTDGMTAVNNIVSADHQPFANIILFGACAILAAIGIYGIHIIRKHTK